VAKVKILHSVIVGAGVSGIGSAIELKRRNIHNFAILERAEELGGTWRDNHYPGVAVDIPAPNYSFSYAQNPKWSRLFAPGSEIQKYVQSVAEKFGVKEHIKYQRHVESISFIEEEKHWQVNVKGGEKILTKYVISATGILNQPKHPEIEGIENFKGKMMHTARWDDSFELKGKRVGIIGTGASAIQVVPAIASEVAQLSVFQRTPIWVLPKNDREFGKLAQGLFSYVPFSKWGLRFLINLGLELGTYVTVNYQKLGLSNRGLENNLRKYVDSQVKDPEVAEKLKPQYGFGCKRPSISSTYLKTFNRDNVSLVTEGIIKITETGIETNDGERHDFDLIILGTGFKVMEEGNAPSFKVYGKKDVELGKFWKENRYQAFNSVSVPGFPNLFLTFGPYSGGLNWFSMLEGNLKFIFRCIDRADKPIPTTLMSMATLQQQHLLFPCGAGFVFGLCL
jgi:cation diffusion facilitator CzcD-associated flavoprotein CzcO